MAATTSYLSLVQSDGVYTLTPSTHLHSLLLFILEDWIIVGLFVCFLYYTRNPNSILALSLNDESLCLCQAICDTTCRSGCYPECATLMPHFKYYSDFLSINYDVSFMQEASSQLVSQTSGFLIQEWESHHAQASSIWYSYTHFHGFALSK